jgi:acetyl esterase/lipase
VAVEPIESVADQQKGQLADAAKQHGLAMELTLWPHVWHGWHLFVPQLPEGTRALKMPGGVVRQKAAFSNP